MREIINKDLGKGIYTIPSDPELIPPSSSQDSLGFISTDGQIELCKGKLLIGAEETANGYVKGEGWGYKSDGTAVHFRKINTRIQYYNTATSLWVDIVAPITGVKARGTLTVAGGGSQILDTNTVTIDTKVYTFKTALTPTEGEILIGANDTAALLNLKNAINQTGTAGVDYSVAAVHPTVTAISSSATTLIVEAKTAGSAGNAIVTTETGGDLSWDAPTLGTTVLGVDAWAGLTDSAEYTFSRYTSPAGTFIYATGVDGIYKIHTANPGNYVSMYDEGKNFKGKSIIGTSGEAARMFMWNVPADKTGLYLSHIDLANSTTYTTVTGESTAAATSGTLAFKSPTFTVTIASPAVFTSTAHGFTAGSSVEFLTTGALPTGIVENKTYYVISAGLTANTFQVSTSVGGAAVNSSGSQSGTHTIKESRRTCFLPVITITATGEIFTDDKNGILSGTLGGTGTINYTTGAWTLSTSSAGTAEYRWEMTNNNGVTDFTSTATRLAGEGNIFRQDEGGDAIEVVHPFEGKYYSLKTRSAYELEISSTPPYVDLSAKNIVFRTDIGIPYWRASVVTGKGIIFMNTANLDKPELTILRKNIQGDNLEPITLANHFDFSAYVWDACAMETFGEFIVFSGRTTDSDTNNKLFLYNVRRDTIDILPYGTKTITTNAGLLYIGDVITDNVYEILSGFDDDGELIEGYWISNDERYGMESLKKVKRLRLKGLITPDQILEVYVEYDNDGYELVGTIRGDGTYVDLTEVYTIGTQGIGTAVIGGESDTIDGSFYFAELKINSPKFRKRSIKLVPTGIGYVSVNMIDDFNIRMFQQRMPSKYRTKQNVSLDGTLTNQ